MYESSGPVLVPCQKRRLMFFLSPLMFLYYNAVVMEISTLAGVFLAPIMEDLVDNMVWCLIFQITNIN